MSHTDAFESMLEQVLESFTLKIGEILDAERVSLFLVDEERRELFSTVAQHDGERPLVIRIPLDAGIAGRVASTGKAMNIADTYSEPSSTAPSIRRPATARARCCACRSPTSTVGCSPSRRP
jgi:adenylate cyclase